ncbi:MAG TPA: hypothetical protein VFA52_03955 [Candidatus Paceibacterota bacterium]|jgi:hypothetical protein|nr:hypothetical protein [Candidatus Paceibacterota bacterium]
MFEKLKIGFVALTNRSLVAPIFNLFSGRCTFFAIVFTVVGIKLALIGKLDANYALFVGAIQSLLVLHSWKEDIAEQNEIKRMKNSS